MSAEENISKFNIKLPKAAAPVGSYAATKIINKLLYISGQISIDENGELIKGKLGKDLKTEDGYKAAIRCALNITAQAKKACNNDLSKIKACIIILKLLIPAVFIAISSDSAFSLKYVIKEARKARNGIIVASSFGIIKIVR